LGGRQRGRGGLQRRDAVGEGPQVRGACGRGGVACGQRGAVRFERGEGGRYGRFLRGQRGFFGREGRF